MISVFKLFRSCVFSVPTTFVYKSCHTIVSQLISSGFPPDDSLPSYAIPPFTSHPRLSDLEWSDVSADTCCCCKCTEGSAKYQLALHALKVLPWGTVNQVPTGAKYTNIYSLVCQWQRGPNSYIIYWIIISTLTQISKIIARSSSCLC